MNLMVFAAVRRLYKPKTLYRVQSRILIEARGNFAGIKLNSITGDRSLVPFVLLFSAATL